MTFTIRVALAACVPALAKSHVVLTEIGARGREREEIALEGGERGKLTRPHLSAAAPREAIRTLQRGDLV